MICLTFIVFMLISPGIQDVFGLDNEDDLSMQAMMKLQNIAMLQQGYSQCCGGKLYPQIKCSGSSICWNTSSLTASAGQESSSENLKRVFSENCMTVAANPDLSITTETGDVRFRCRKQGNEVYCFAYRCKDSEPAGCEQKWRIEQKGTSTDASSYKCIDLGDPEAGGICQNRPELMASPELAEPICGSCE